MDLHPRTKLPATGQNTALLLPTTTAIENKPLKSKLVSFRQILQTASHLQQKQHQLPGTCQRHANKPHTRQQTPTALVYTFSFPNYNAETYFPTEQSPSPQDARFSETHEDGRWPRRSFAPTRTGPQEADCQLGEVVRITNDYAAGTPAKQPEAPQSGFPKSVRLLRSSDFRKVYDNGVRYSCPLFAAFCLAEPLEAGNPSAIPAREPGRRAVGFTTPKALGKAVKRNRIRRRIREAARLELASLSAGWSIVFNPRRKVLDCIFTDLQHEVKRLFIRCATSPASPQSGSRPSSGGTSA